MRNYRFNAIAAVIACWLIGMCAPSVHAMQPKGFSQADAIHEVQYMASHDAWKKEPLAPDVVTGIITKAMSQSPKFKAFKQGVAEAPPFTRGTPAAPFFSARTPMAAKPKITETVRQEALGNNPALGALNKRVQGLDEAITCGKTQQQYLIEELGNAEADLNKMLFPATETWDEGDLLHLAVATVSDSKNSIQQLVLEELITQLKASYHNFLELCKKAPLFRGKLQGGKLTQEAFVLAKIEQITSGREAPAATPEPKVPTTPKPQEPSRAAPFSPATESTAAMGESKEEEAALLLKWVLGDIKTITDRIANMLQQSFPDLKTVAEHFIRIFFTQKEARSGTGMLDDAQKLAGTDIIQNRTLNDLKTRLFKLGSQFKEQWQKLSSTDRQDHRFTEEEVSKLLAALSTTAAKKKEKAEGGEYPKPMAPAFTWEAPATSIPTSPTHPETKEPFRAAPLFTGSTPYVVKSNVTKADKDKAFDENYYLRILNVTMETLTYNIQDAIEAQTEKREDDLKKYLGYSEKKLNQIIFPRENEGEDLLQQAVKAVAESKDLIQKKILQELITQLKDLYQKFLELCKEAPSFMGKLQGGKLTQEAFVSAKINQITSELEAPAAAPVPTRQPEAPTAPSTFAWGAPAATPMPIPTSPTLAPSEPFRSPPSFPAPRPATGVSQQEKAEGERILKQITAIGAEPISLYVSSATREEREQDKRSRIANLIDSIKDTGILAQAQKDEGERLLRQIHEIGAETISLFAKPEEREKFEQNKRSRIANLIESIKDTGILAQAQKDEGERLLRQIHEIGAETISLFAKPEEREKFEQNKRSRIANLIESIKDTGILAQAQKDEGERLLRQIHEIGAETISLFAKPEEREKFEQEKQSRIANLIESIKNPDIHAQAQKDEGERLLRQIHEIGAETISLFAKPEEREKFEQEKQSRIANLIKSIKDPTIKAQVQEGIAAKR